VQHRRHEPSLVQRPDRCWEVVCPQCLNDKTLETPIGIGLRMRDRRSAEMVVENHRGAYDSKLTA